MHISAYFINLFHKLRRFYANGQLNVFLIQWHWSAEQTESLLSNSNHAFVFFVFVAVLSNLLPWSQFACFLLLLRTLCVCLLFVIFEWELKVLSVLFPLWRSMACAVCPHQTNVLNLGNIVTLFSSPVFFLAVIALTWNSMEFVNNCFFYGIYSFFNGLLKKKKRSVCVQR